MKLKILNFIFFCISKKYFWYLLKQKIDLDATYFKLHLTIIKFPTLEISSEWSGGFTYVPYDIFRGIY